MLNTSVHICLSPLSYLGFSYNKFVSVTFSVPSAFTCTTLERDYFSILTKTGRFFVHGTVIKRPVSHFLVDYAAFSIVFYLLNSKGFFFKLRYVFIKRSVQYENL